MNLLNQTNTLRLFKRIFDSKNATETIIPYYIQKKEFTFNDFEKSSYCKGTFLDPKILISFLKDIEKHKSVNVHSLCISKDGKTVLKFSTRYHNTKIPHAVHSASKSITSLACGILISQNKLSLNDKLCDILPEIYNPVTKYIQRNITVENLLTMSTGIGFNETEVYSDVFYDKAFALSPLSFIPGTAFSYNSLNSYMLGRIIEKISGLKLSDFVDKNIFNPLGITNYYWEECPKGHTKGGWGLYISCEDILKIGNLYLQNGLYQGKRIVSEEWIKKATSSNIETPKEIGDFDYGYHIWVSRDRSCYLMNGMFGQNVFCFPENNICIAINGGLDDFFQTNEIYAIVKKYFTNVTDKKGSPFTSYRLKSLLNKLSNNYHSVKCKSNTLKFNTTFKLFSGKSYNIISTNNASVGIMPVVLQILQNNYTKGITSIKFARNDKKNFIIITESGNEYKIPLGDKIVSYRKMNFNGEIYNVAVSCDFAKNESGDIVLKLKLDFNETASTKYINITFIEDKIKIKLFETPELEFMFSNIDYFLKGVSIKSVRNLITSGFESDITKAIYDNLFKPELIGKSN